MVPAAVVCFARRMGAVLPGFQGLITVLPLPKGTAQ